MLVVAASYLSEPGGVVGRAGPGDLIYLRGEDLLAAAKLTDDLVLAAHDSQKPPQLLGVIFYPSAGPTGETWARSSR